MLRRASRFRFTPLAVVLSLAALGPVRAFAQQAEELPTDARRRRPASCNAAVEVFTVTSA